MAKRKIDLNIAKVVTNGAHFNENSSEQSKGQVVSKISIDLLKENPYQPRMMITSDSLKDLSESIKVNGLLQPITVSKTGDELYTIIYGHRRTAAFKMLDKQYIDAIVLDNVAHEQLSILPLIENLQREDMNAIETALAMQKILDDKILNNQQELANKLGYSKSWLSRVMSVLKLPSDLVELVRADGYNDIHVLSALNKLQENHLEVYKSIINLDRTTAIKYIKSLSEKKSYEIC
jgi:ParB family chromosome partitioning protein